MLIKTLIKKPLLVLDNGLKLKIESKIIIDRYFRKIRYLVVKNENQIFYIDTQKIFNTKNDAIVIKKFEFLILKNDFEYKATHFLVDINSMVYNTCGEFICHIENFEIDLNFKILQIIFKTQIKNL
ncbi:MAG: hypothetical protein IJW82_03425 [Clostridia bacterium]|nr:hypothetical protein [Clostridia bacterium]